MFYKTFSDRISSYITILFNISCHKWRLVNKCHAAVKQHNKKIFQLEGIIYLRINDVLFNDLDDVQYRLMKDRAQLTALKKTHISKSLKVLFDFGIKSIKNVLVNIAYLPLKKYRMNVTKSVWYLLFLQFTKKTSSITTTITK